MSLKAQRKQAQGQKTRSAPTAKQKVEQKKESARVEGKQKATNGSKPKVSPKTKSEPKAKKEVQAEKGDEKVMATAITPAKMGEVQPSAGIRKQQPESLPLAISSES